MCTCQRALRCLLASTYHDNPLSEHAQELAAAWKIQGGGTCSPHRGHCRTKVQSPEHEVPRHLHCMPASAGNVQTWSCQGARWDQGPRSTAPSTSTAKPTIRLSAKLGTQKGDTSLCGLTQWDIVKRTWAAVKTKAGNGFVPSALTIGEGVAKTIWLCGEMLTITYSSRDASSWLTRIQAKRCKAG
jgi:hypothetical protein